MPDPNNVIVTDGDQEMVFICPCRAGNTTLKMLLWETLYGVPTDQMAKSRPKDWHIHASEQRFSYINPKRIDPDRHLIIGLMREPMARALSMWGYSLTEKPLDQWMRQDVEPTPDHESNQHVRTQAWDLMREGEVLPHLMIYLEHIEEDWASLCLMRGWPVVPLPEFTNSLEDRDCPRRPPQSSPRVYARYAADFVLYKHLEPLRAVYGARRQDIA